MENDEPYTLEELTDIVGQIADNVSTLNAALACVLTTLRREGIELAKPGNVTIN